MLYIVVYRQGGDTMKKILIGMMVFLSSFSTTYIILDVYENHQVEKNELLEQKAETEKQINKDLQDQVQVQVQEQGQDQDQGLVSSETDNQREKALEDSKHVYNDPNALTIPEKMELYKIEGEEK